MGAPVNVTLLLQGEEPSAQLGTHRAFEEAVAAGRLSAYKAFCYQQAANQQEWHQLWESVIEHCVETEVDVLYLQFFHLKGAVDPRPYLDRIRALPKNPLIVTSCGDPFGAPREPPPKSLMRAASRSDLFLSSSMGRIAQLAVRAGSKHVALMANAACHVRHATLPPTGGLDGSPIEPTFDVTYIGTKKGGKNVFRGLYATGRQRVVYVERLTERYGSAFALYGANWEGSPSWQGVVDFDQQALASRSGRVVFGGFPASMLDYYHSDRIFIQNLSGRPMVDFRVPGLDRLLEEDEEWLLFDDIDEAIRKIDWLLDHPDRAAEIGSNAAGAVRDRHLSSHRVDLTITMIEALLDSRASGRTPHCPPLDFLVPSGTKPEYPVSMNW